MSFRTHALAARLTSTLFAMAAGGALVLVLMTAASEPTDRLAAQDRLRGRALDGVTSRSPAMPRPSVAADELSAGFRDVADLMRPSVVAIRTKTVQNRSPPRPATRIAAGVRRHVRRRRLRRSNRQT